MLRWKLTAGSVMELRLKRELNENIVLRPKKTNTYYYKEQKAHEKLLRQKYT